MTRTAQSTKTQRVEDTAVAFLNVELVGQRSETAGQRLGNC